MDQVAGSYDLSQRSRDGDDPGRRGQGAELVGVKLTPRCMTLDQFRQFVNGLF